MNENYILGIIGYTGTGKDTLFKIINKEITQYENWVVYCKSKENNFENLINKKYYRLALADKLKEKICKLFNLKYSEQDKDKKNILINDQMYSFRDLCKNYALNNDKLIWINKIIKIIKNNNNNYMITDLRLKHELKKLKKFDNFVSIRIFNGSNDIPDYDINTEHELDDYVTDFLFLRNIEFEDFLKLFSEYRNFQKVANL